MGTKETDIVGHNATTVTVANDNGKKMGALMTAAETTATTPSPLKTPSPSDQITRTSPKGGQPTAAIAVIPIAADELTNGGGSSGKSTNSSPGALNATGSGGSGAGGLAENIAKNRSPTDSVRNLNINNNQDNGNANDESGKMKIGEKSPSYDGKIGGRNDSVRGRRPTDGDNNVNVENGAGEFL